MSHVVIKPPQGSPCRPVATRIKEKVASNGAGCWIWAGMINPDGYGVMGIGSKMDGTNRSISAHRAAYEAFVAPIPDGMEVDHLCRVRSCVNPAHLEAVSRQENIRRSDGPSALNARKTHCDYGHEFSPENTNVLPPKRPGRAVRRQCRTCEKRRQAAKYLRRRAKRLTAGGDQ